MRTPGFLMSGAAALMVVAGLAGCQTGSASYADLDRAVDPAHAVPDGILGALDSVEESTARWAGETNGTDLWIVRGTERDTVCILVLPGDGDWASTCGEGSEVSLGEDGPTFGLLRDGQLIPPAATAVSGNIYVID